MVARSSAEAEFRGMSHGVCELLWLKKLLRDLGFKPNGAMKLHCDNKAAIEIAHNPVQHDRTKHVEIDRHFIKEKLDAGIVMFPFEGSEDQLADDQELLEYVYEREWSHESNIFRSHSPNFIFVGIIV